MNIIRNSVLWVHLEDEASHPLLFGVDPSGAVYGSVLVLPSAQDLLPLVQVYYLECSETWWRLGYDTWEWTRTSEINTYWGVEDERD